MLNFLKRLFGSNKQSQAPSQSWVGTFVDATGGGWSEAPEVIAVDGGSQKDYVASQLELARQCAAKMDVGDTFSYHLTDIPVGISSPHEIMVGMMMQAHQYGLEVGIMADERIELTRIA